MKTIMLLPALLLAGCATSNPAFTPVDHPAATAPLPTPSYAAATALPPVSQPNLPAPLRPDGHRPAASSLGLDPAAVDEMDHGQMESSSATPALSDALDAYLAIQEALAADRLDGLAAQAQAFDAVFAVLIESPPADDPHFWHMRATETTAVRTHAQALAEAPDLLAARQSFGALSHPFVALIEAIGVPEGYTLAQFTCGMAEAPEGGVWLQRGNATQNPFFGTAMPTCGTHEGVLPAHAEGTTEGHDGH